MTDEPAAPEPQQYRASDADRERVAKILHNAMGEGRITMSELEERLKDVYAAKTLGELTPITSDIPGSQVVIAEATAPVPTADARPPANERVVHAEPTSRTAIAVMSGTDRKGHWVVPPTFNALAMMGGVEIDLCYATFSQHEVTIQATAIMGGVEITVPEDVTVHVNGIGFMGAFENRVRSSPPPGSPVVRVTGLALMGSVEVKHPKKKRKKAELEE